MAYQQFENLEKFTFKRSNPVSFNFKISLETIYTYLWLNYFQRNSIFHVMNNCHLRPIRWKLLVVYEVPWKYFEYVTDSYTKLTAEWKKKLIKFFHSCIIKYQFIKEVSASILKRPNDGEQWNSNRNWSDLIIFLLIAYCIVTTL